MPTSKSLRRPFEGIRVADLSLVLAGPHATSYLADWGAECIRVEPLQVLQASTRGRFARPTQPYIDSMRNWINAYPNFTMTGRDFNCWPFFQSHAKNKMSMTVDLQQEEGIEVLKQLVAVSDIVIENNAPSTVDKLGIDYDALRAVKPDIVMLRMPAYGLTGPYAYYRSLGSHLEGTSGHTYIRGYRDTDPTQTEDIFLADAVAALHGAYAAALALLQLRRTGKGQIIELSQAECMVSFFGEHLLGYQMSGESPGPQGNDYYGMAPHNTYPCAGDDRWVAIAVGNDAQWQGLVEAMDRPEWTNDPRFATQDSRFEHRDELDGLVAQWTSRFDDKWIMRHLQEHGVPAGALNDDRDLMADPQLNAREFFHAMDHECMPIEYPRSPWLMQNTESRLDYPPPTLGQHNAYVYGDLLGFDDAEQRRLEQAGHIGDEYPPHIA